MKKKNGFTLIELLVTISLALSILAIVVVSVIKISDRKKEQAYGLVKEQVVDAAQEYLSSNEYLFEGLEGDVEGSISVGTLVQNDYLNKVVNPKTGKALNKCNYVQIKRTNGRYTYDFKDDKPKCDTKSLVVLKETGGPKIECTIDGTIGNNDWYTTNPKLTVTATPNKNGEIKDITKDEISVFQNSTKIDNGYEYKEIISDTTQTQVTFTAVNVAGKKAVAQADYKVDTTKPVCGEYSYSGTLGDNNWYISDVKFTIEEPTDQTSGIIKDWRWYYTVANGFYAEDDKKNNGKYEYSLESEGKNRHAKYVVYDNAGNRNDCETKSINIDRNDPTCTITASGSQSSERYGTNKDDWYISDVTLSISGTDTSTGSHIQSGTENINGRSSISLTDEQERTTYEGSVKDQAGREGTCNKTVGIEKNVTLEFDSTNTNGTISYNPGKTSHNSSVFDTTKTNVCSFGNCSDIKAHDGDTSTTSSVSKAYFARACMTVSDYFRYFKISAISLGTNVSACTYGTDSSESASTDGCRKSHNSDKLTRSDKTWKHMNNKYNWNDDYDISSANHKSGQTVSTAKDQFRYTSPAGNKSNIITLYVEYRGECDY